jgi:hypothetical protein
MIEG